MRVGGRVEDDEADAVAARLLNPVDQPAFEIALVANYLSARGAPGVDPSAIDGLRGLPPIDRRPANFQEIEIGSAKDKNLPVPWGFPDFRHFSQEYAAF